MAGNRVYRNVSSLQEEEEEQQQEEGVSDEDSEDTQ